jgi:hypothetical protein
MIGACSYNDDKNEAQNAHPVEETKTTPLGKVKAK